MRKLGMALAGVLLGVSVAGTANAGYVDFTFNGSNSDNVPAAQHTFSAGGYQVTANAYYDNLATSDVAWLPTSLSRQGNALGVNRPDGAGSDEDKLIDSKSAYADGLLFNFGSGAWSSLTISLNQFSSSDRVNVWVGNTFNAASAAFPLAHQVVTAGSTAPITIPFDFQYLFIAATDGSNSRGSFDSDGFRVAGIRAVPEPASIALIGVALAGLGFSSKRRSKNRA